MAYDFDEAVTTTEPRAVSAAATRAAGVRYESADLEAIVTLLELAAIYLTPTPGTEFTLEQMLGEVRAIGGDEISIDEKDVEIVLDKAAFLKKAQGRFSLK